MAKQQEDKLDILKKHIMSYPDFPKPGILFRDVFSLLQVPDAFEILIDLMCEQASAIKPSVEAVVGLDSRGFLFAPIIALNLKIPFVPIRKKGKLPGVTKKVTYDLEYGQDILEIQETSLKPGQKVLIVDDLIATGGSLNAACKLVSEIGGVVSECLVVLELEKLEGRAKVNANVTSLLQF